MSKLFDEMPEELLKMLIGESLEKTKEVREDFDWDNPPVHTDLFPTLVPEEAIKKLVEVRKLLIEVKELLPDIPKLSHAESLNAYARLHAVFFSDEVQTTLVTVNTLLHSHDDEMTQQVVEVIDEKSSEDKTVPTKTVTSLIKAHMMKKVFEDIFNN